MCIRDRFKNDNVKMIGLNTVPFDAAKRDSQPLVADAREGLTLLSEALGGWKAPAAFTETAKNRKDTWMAAVARATAPTNACLLYTSRCV